MAERRYKEHEVREIFELAARGSVSDKAVTPVAEGLTLEEIQSIGAEVGLAPAVVARAAAQLDVRPQNPRRSFGMPIEVGSEVLLDRPLTDREWAQFVGELRHTFKAQGHVRDYGDLRSWSNGNLRVSVEPADAGYRVRFHTLKGDVSGYNALGVTGLATGALIALVMNNPGTAELLVPYIFGAGGVGAFLANVFRVPRWRRTRHEQFEQLAARVKKMTESPAEPA